MNINKLESMVRTSKLMKEIGVHDVWDDTVHITAELFLKVLEVHEWYSIEDFSKEFKKVKVKINNFTYYTFMTDEEIEKNLK